MRSTAEQAVVVRRSCSPISSPVSSPTAREDPTTTLAHSTALASAESDAICATAANHGEAVSSVAKDDSTVGADHGAAVSTMANSDCGKTDDESPAPTTTLPAICA